MEKVKIPLFTEAAENLFWHNKDNNITHSKDDYIFIDGTIHLKSE